MKSVLWRGSLARYVVPHLPGEWQIRRTLLYREPVDWILCGLDLGSSRSSTGWSVYVVAQLLARPKKCITGPNLWELGHGTPRGLWGPVSTIEEAEPVMAEILDLTRVEALPFFDQVATVAGFMVGAQERVQRQPDDVNYQESLFCLQLINGDVDAALHTAQAADRAAHTDGRGWALAVGARVARIADTARRNPAEAVEILRAQADQTRTHLGLPPRTT